MSILTGHTRVHRLRQQALGARRVVRHRERIPVGEDVLQHRVRAHRPAEPGSHDGDHEVDHSPLGEEEPCENRGPEEIACRLGGWNEVPQEGEGHQCGEGEERRRPPPRQEPLRERGGEPLADLPDHRLGREPPAPQPPENSRHPEDEGHEEKRSEQHQVELVDRNDPPEEVKGEGGKVEPRRAAPADLEEREKEGNRPPEEGDGPSTKFPHGTSVTRGGEGEDRYGFFPYSRTEST